MAAPEVVPVQPANNAPPDSDTVRIAIRLGWYLAELRGRYWWRGQRPPVTGLPVDPPYALPLRPERSAAEAREQACEAVVAMANRLGLVYPFGQDQVPDEAFSARLAALVRPLEADADLLLEPPATGAAPEDVAAREKAWEQVAALLHDWDSSIQNTLTARVDILANAYLLGRGLAECYWALGPENPDAPAGGVDSAAAWGFLLGPGRRRELSRLVGRVGPSVHPLTPAAVSGSIEAWGCVAADPEWRAADGDRLTLYEQLRRWYELLVLGRDPTTYVRPYAVLKGWRTTLHAFRTFWPQLVLGLVSVGAVFAVVYFLSTDRGSAVLTTVLGLAGTLGLTAATVSGKAKNAGTRLLARWRQDAYSDLVAVAVASVPPSPQRGTGLSFRRPTTERRVRRAVTERRITPATTVPDTPAGAL